MDMALQMLRMNKNIGVERIALTPHFYPLREELDSFLDRRQRSYTALMSAWNRESMPEIRLGAEVRYTPSLLQMDLHQLTIGKGDYLLLELPDVGLAPCLAQVTDGILTQGVTPIFAHIERCRMFRDEPNLLLELIQMGALAQIDVKALTGRKKDIFAIKCLNKGLAHLIASDIHNLTDRAFTLADAATAQSMEMLYRAEEFARAVWDCTPLPAFAINPVNKGFLGYY